jgi:hypothetical protein
MLPLSSPICKVRDIKSTGAIALVELLSETLQHPFEHRLRPTLVIKLAGGGLFRWQLLITRFGALGMFQREDLLAAASLWLRARSHSFVR